MPDFRFAALAALSAAVLLLGAFPAATDVVIKLKDGTSMTVPIDSKLVDSVQIVPAAGAPAQPAATQQPAATPAPAAARPESAPATGSAGIRGGMIWKVGPGRRYEKPSEVAKVARDGDTIEVQAGVYTNDFTTFRQNDLTLRSVGGRAHIKGTQLIGNGKAIWIIAGDNVVVDGFEFSGARVHDTNGAGIRVQGIRLTIRNSYFHDNQMAILGGGTKSNVLIESSEFANQKREGRYTHSVYVAGDTLTMRFNYIHGTNEGHHIKSRARFSDIRYNRIVDGPDGNASYLIDLPSCGHAVIVGNVLHKGRNTNNYTAIAYGMEDCGGREKGLAVVNNTYVNDNITGPFVHNRSLTPALVANNIVMRGKILVEGEADARANIVADDARITSADDFDFRLRKGSPALGAAVDAGERYGRSLMPEFEYVHPLSSQKRTSVKNVGAFESRS